MPTIRFHSIKEENIINAGLSFQQRLADSFQTTLDNISIEVVHSTFISMGSIETPIYPRIEILSFKRDADIEAAAVKTIHEILQAEGYPTACDIYYIHLSETAYYVDGEVCE